MVKQNSKVFLEENFLKRHETAVVDELDRGVRNKSVWAWLDCQDANEDFYASCIRKLNVPGQAVCTICNKHRPGSILSISPQDLGGQYRVCTVLSSRKLYLVKCFTSTKTK